VLSATWHKWTRPALTPASKLVLDLPTPEGWKAELTYATRQCTGRDSNSRSFDQSPTPYHYTTEPTHHTLILYQNEHKKLSYCLETARHESPPKTADIGRGNDNVDWKDLQMSYKVIISGTNRKLVYDFLLVVYSNFCCIRLREIWCETLMTLKYRQGHRQAYHLNARVISYWQFQFLWAYSIYFPRYWTTIFETDHTTLNSLIRMRILTTVILLFGNFTKTRIDC